VAKELIPCRRGFNLLEKFSVERNGAFVESDFRWMAEKGFDFVRLPMDYRCWLSDGQMYEVNEAVLREIDQAIEFGEHYGIHININFHRTPGYCVNRQDLEPFNLWTDSEALEATCFHWRLFAERYKGVPSQLLSFNLFNEPPAEGQAGFSRARHSEVVRKVVDEIRVVDPDRLIYLDGIEWGRKPLPECTDLEVVQSTRFYTPMWLSHYKASWIRGSDEWPEPIWPGEGLDGYWDKSRLEEAYRPWAELAAQGVSVHAGEGGAFNRTPHGVVLAWLTDVLAIMKDLGFGWALWNLRGSFGVLDSERKDVDYVETADGHALDQQMLDTLCSYIPHVC